MINDLTVVLLFGGDHFPFGGYRGHVLEVEKCFTADADRARIVVFRGCRVNDDT